MKISTFITQPCVEFHDDQYETEPDYIQCLARVVRAYTSDDIGRDDTAIPLAIRISALNPHIPDEPEEEITELRSIYNEEGRPYLRHAAAIIPATNGAFWAVYPFSSGLATEVDEYQEDYARSVWYFPPNATKETDGIPIGRYEDGWVIPDPRDYTKDTAYPDPARVAPLDSLRKSHPSGASYTNVRVPIEYDSGILEELHFRSTGSFSDDLRDFLHQFVPWESPIPGEKLCVDVLVCCGGYYWDRVADEKTPRFRLSNTLRLFVPTTSFVKEFSIPDEKEVTTTADSDARLAQTIATPMRMRSYKWAGYHLGSTVIALKSRPGNIVVGGGCVVSEQYSEKEPKSRKWFKRDEGPLKDIMYPGHMIPLQVHVNAYTRKEGDYVTHKVYRLVCDVSTKRRYLFGEEENPPINICTKELLKAGETVFLRRNYAPILYPTILEVGNEIITYGGDFFKFDVPPEVQETYKWPEKTKEHPIIGLNHFFHCMINENESDRVFNVPLLSCQYARIRVRYHHKALIWKPLNIGGAHGIAEGAVPIPYPDDGKIVLVGGAETEGAAVCGGYQVCGNDGEKYPNTLSPFDKIRVNTDNAYPATSIRNIPLYSKIIPVLSTKTEFAAFELGMDTLKYDCLHSPAIQLGSSDYFVLPHSVMKYEYPPEYSTNATLIRRRKTRSLTPEELKGDDVKALWDAYARMFVSEVVGMPVRCKNQYRDEDSPYHYQVSHPVRGSIGAITVEENKEYWIYDLGYGMEPAKYYHIEIVTTAKSLLPHDGRSGSTRLDAGVSTLVFNKTLPYPGKWDGGEK